MGSEAGGYFEEYSVAKRTGLGIRVAPTPQLSGQRRKCYGTAILPLLPVRKEQFLQAGQ
ncbi:MAG: hypothetical protein J6L94_06200 [Acidaminococcaceae bacterium]|nr:hypothetical protein [Acidaminococcaceae bacterium]